MKKSILIICIIFAVFTVFSCNVSLGNMVNLDPPVITIIKPDFMENISSQLEITGTASDLQEIVHIYITVERVSKTGTKWMQEWHGQRGVWQSRSSPGDSWTQRSGLWEIETQGFVKWSISIPILEADDGEYLITAGAENNVENKGSKEERRVIIDKEGPVTKILLPVLDFEDTSEITYSYYEDVFMTFEKYKLEDPSVLNKLFNQNINVQYEVSDDFSLDTLVFQLADNEGNIYYNADKVPLSSATWSGRMEIAENEINLLAGNIVHPSPYYLQLITIAKDKAGNEKIKSHGWFVYWPEADKPWAAGIGDLSNPHNFEVYPESEMQLMAYDDDGVYKVTYQIFKWENNAANNLVSSGEKINEPVNEDSLSSPFYSFAITAPVECAEFVIRVKCEDVNGLTSFSKDRYFFVMDITMPAVEIESPIGTQTLFGDSSGKFNIKGNASDGRNPSELLLVWIKPGNNQDQFEYQSAESNVWDIFNTASEGSASDSTPYWKDSKGNLLWKIDLSVTQTTKDGRVHRSFNKDMNLFSDLGISKTLPLITQTFIFRVKGSTGRAVTRLHSVRGDITPPSLSIERIRIKRGAVFLPDIPADSFNNPDYQMPNLEVQDEIYINGTWDDDSLAAWNNVLRLGDFSVTWNGLAVANAKINLNKTWDAGPFVMNTDEVLKGGGRIEVKLNDFGGNMASCALSARADTNVPILMFISSETPDGSYNAGKTIEIYAEFNKSVKYTGAGAKLSLNSGAEAIYKGQSRENQENDHRHIFTYTVQNSDTNVNDLDVTSITTVESHWIDDAGNNPNMQIPQGRNLANTKQIVIDTASPLIESVESLSDSGYYNKGKTIYLLLTFNEDINFIPGTANQAFLSLNVGAHVNAGTAKDPMLMGQKSILFTYLIQENDNSSALRADSFSLGSLGAQITDAAGNSLDDMTIPANNNIPDNLKNIIIDTLSPSSPVLNTTAVSGQSYTFPQSFTITGEPNAVREYQINGGPWLLYSSEVTLSTADTYSIRARQTDMAGNESLPTSAVEITIIREDVLLQSFGGSTPGTYTIGNQIEIKFNLNASRSPIGVTGNPRLKLNITKSGGQTAYAEYDSLDGSSLVFKYTVAAGDSVNVLEIESLDFNGAAVTSGGEDVSNELRTDYEDHHQLFSFYTRISVRTDIPQLTDAALTNTALTLTFSEDVYKGSAGSITFLQPADTYRAPAVMTKSDYNRFGGSALSSYYTPGTNGTDKDGNPDLSEKYILRYEVDPNNAALKTILTNSGANKVEILVVSGAVTINGNVMTVDVSENWGYNLRVKGVAYTLTIQNSIVRDEQNNYLNGNISGFVTRTLTNPGVNEPFIRVQRNRGEFTTQTISLVDPQIVNTTYWANLADAQTQISWNDPGAAAGQTWRQVDQYRITGNYSTQTEEPGGNANTRKFWQPPEAVPATFWVNGADVAQTAQEGWINIAQYIITPPFNISLTAQTGYVEAAMQAHQGNYIRVTDVTTTAPQNTDGYIFVAANSDFGNGWHSNQWVQIDTSAPVLSAVPSPGNNYVLLTAGLTVYVQHSSIVYPAAQQYNGTVIAQHWLNGDTGTWELNNMQGTAGWVPVTRNMMVWIDIATAAWSDWQGHQLPRYWIRIDNIRGTPSLTTTSMQGTAGWVRVVVPDSIGGSSISTPVTSQPRTARVRIDSQTPSAQIRYSIAQSNQSPRTGTSTVPFDGAINPSLPSFNMIDPDEVNRANGVEFTLLNGDTSFDGYVFGISARAILAPAPVILSGITYEKATRSVIQFNFNTLPQNWSTTNTDANATGNLKARAADKGRALQLWLRGGDDISGNNSITGFPLSWDENDYKGARLMTNTNPQGSSNSGTWYWMSWEITDTAYFYFLGGTTGDASTLDDIQANGPLDWAWGKNAWAVQQQRYPLYPGGSLLFTTGTIVDNPATATFEFYDNFSGSR